MGKQIRHANNVRTGEMYLEMPNGIRVEAKSAMHPDSMVGKGLMRAVFTEAAKMPDFIWHKVVRPALADFRGDAIFPSTPEGLNWFYDLHQRGKNPADKEYASWNFPAWENPYVYPGGFDDPEVQSQMASDDDPWFWQELGADFTKMVGLIYSEFSREKHVRKIEYDPRIPNYLWVDFGWNVTCALDVMIDANENVWIWREYYAKHTKNTPEDHVRILASREQPPQYGLAGGSADSADPAAVETFTRGLRIGFQALPEAKDPWEVGVRLVKKWLANGKVFIDPSCENTINEFQNYRMKMPTLRQRNAEEPKERPKKKDDHAMDAVRYGMMHQFELGGRHHYVDLGSDMDRIPSGLLTLGGDGGFSRTPNLDEYARDLGVAL